MFRVPCITFSSMKSTQTVIPNMLCWSGCPDDSYSYGSNIGGEFTTALLNYMSKNISYDDVWNKISSDKHLKSFQTVKQTKLGNFDTTVKFLK